MQDTRVKSVSVPLMRPQLPRAKDLLPYLNLIDSNQIYSNFGPLNELLQSQLGQKMFEWFGVRPHVITTSNGTSAIEILLQTLRLPPNSRVLVPALTFVATCTAVRRMGYQPIIADVDADSWLMTPKSIAGINLDGIAAVIPVATFGAPQDARAWSKWSNKTGIKVIIDAAAGFGSQNVAENVPAAFSLHATKALGAAEGGFILTLDSEQATNVKKLTNFGIPDLSDCVGTNAKLSEYHAAIALAALKAWESTLAKRVSALKSYMNGLQQSLRQGNIGVQSAMANVPSVFLVRFNSKKERDRCMHLCDESGVGTRVWYTPLMGSHPATVGVARACELRNARFLEDRLLGLPFYPGLTALDIDSVVALVKGACADSAGRGEFDSGYLANSRGRIAFPAAISRSTAGDLSVLS